MYSKWDFTAGTAMAAIVMAIRPSWTMAFGMILGSCVYNLAKKD